MRIKLITPHQQNGNNIMSSETFKLQRLSLPMLAACTPQKHSVQIVDESFGPDNPDEEVDLVGISVVTELALRAYEISEGYRQRGITVVMGGIHPTVAPQEALGYCDSVAVGEGEHIWPVLLDDFTRGNLQKIYQADQATSLTGLPIPRRDLYPKPLGKSYTPLAVSMESSRGCPYDCEFCTIGTTLGRKYRVRPVEEVIDELAGIDFPNIFFIDDSLGLNRNHAKKLFTEMIPLKKRWIGQGTVSIASDRELLSVMRKSGCKGLLIGFESVQSGAKDHMKKIDNPDLDFYEAMRRFHDEGIAVMGAFVFGFDYEDRDVFDRTLEFVVKARIDALQLRILTPFPGTRIYQRLITEGRLLVRDWWLKGYSSKMLLFRPKNMRMDEFIEGFIGLVRHSYSMRSIFSRFFGISPFKRGIVGTQVYLGYNLATRHRYLKNLEDPGPYSGINPLYYANDSLGSVEDTISEVKKD